VDACVEGIFGDVWWNLYFWVKYSKNRVAFEVEDNSRRLKLGNDKSFYSERRREKRNYE
jgi:hypothetical protein